MDCFVALAMTRADHPGRLAATPPPEGNDGHGFFLGPCLFVETREVCS
ncbi:MAG: hypothetical protein LBN34_08080 [Clostridiales Family XIII bacterium]|nr:hypothetical protein [Clostridiales Family XIII bacterium]